MSFFKQDPDGPPSYGNHVGHSQAASSRKHGFGAAPISHTTNMYAVLHLSMSDKIQLINFPPKINDLLQDTIMRVWPSIQRQGMTSWGTYEFKLRGNPWRGVGSEAVPSKRLMIHILHALSSAGWHLSASVDMTKKTCDKDTLFFRAGPPITRQFFSVTFHESDKVRIIDAPNDTVKSEFMRVVGAWPAGIQDRKEKEHGCYQFKLRGNPWFTSQGSSVMAARVLACNLFSAMDVLGFELAGTIDMNTGGSEGRDMDSWFFASKI